MTGKALAVFGTRPEAIKMAPVVRALIEGGIDCRVCVTAQHREMLDQVLGLFGIQPEYDLDIMQPDQDLYDVTARSLLGIRDVLHAERPEVVLVQGDTTTCFAGALAAFYEKIPVAHVEAGLRTRDLYAPYPEEANRQLTTRLTSLHFAPTRTSRENLVREGVPDDSIWVTGNTVIDALQAVREMVGKYPPEHWRKLFGDNLFERVTASGVKKILVTGHRRENFGKGFAGICNAIHGLAMEHPDWLFVYPVHLNPNVRRAVYGIIGDVENIRLLEPMDYAPFIWLMGQSDLVLTDSGGIQEEAPGLGKPVLVMRSVTERPEGVEAGTVRLVGTDTRQIVEGVETVLEDRTVYERMASAHNPYGDGTAARRIMKVLAGHVPASA